MPPARVVLGAALLALATAGSQAADLGKLRDALERSDAAAVSAWLGQAPTAAADDPLARLDAPTGASLRERATHADATDDMLDLLARAYAQSPDPGLRDRLLAMVDGQRAARASLDADLRAAAARPAAVPLRLGPVTLAPQPPAGVVAGYAHARAGDAVRARWLAIGSDPAHPRLIGETSAALAPGDGRVTLAMPGTPDAGAYRVELAAREATAVTIFALPTAPPAPEAAPPPPPAVAAPPPASKPPEHTRDETRYATRAVTLRAAPDAKSAAAGQLARGEAVHVVGAAEAADWLAVERNGKRSYAPAAALSPDRPKPPAPPVASAPAPAPAPAPLEGEARVVDTANLMVAGRPVRLYAIDGIGGGPADQMARFLAEQGGRVRCMPQGAAFLCRTATGVDLARAALVNGAARARAEAPADYRRQEDAARSSRRGIWAAS